MALYAQPDFREAFLAEVKSRRRVQMWTQTRVLEVQNPALAAWAGKTVQEIADAQGKRPVDAYLDLSIADSLETRYQTANFNYDQDGVERLVADDRFLIGLSDGGAHVDFLCDVGYATALLDIWVRQKKVLTLEKAVQKLTSVPAALFGIPNRGVLAEGKVADLVLLTPTPWPRSRRSMRTTSRVGAGGSSPRPRAWWRHSWRAPRCSTRVRTPAPSRGACCEATSEVKQRSPKLLATDLDGTLLDSSGAIHGADRRAIAELMRRGVAVTIVTGRMYAGTRDIARSLGLAGPICCVDGSAIVGVKGDRDLVSHPIAHEVSAPLRSAIATSRTAAFVLGRNEIVHDTHGTPFVPYLKAWSPHVTEVDDISASPHWTGAASLVGLIAVGSQEEIEGLARGIAGAAGDRVESVAFPVRRDEFRGRWAMVTRAAGATKGSGLQWIASHHGVDVSEVIAVGDWLNDVSMLRLAGRSFAMAHAPEEVKAAATDQLRADVTTGGGIAEAAERAGLL